jgi:hypothetical protein
MPARSLSTVRAAAGTLAADGLALDAYLVGVVERFISTFNKKR